MKFDKFWEDVIRWFPEETSEELEDKRELLKAAYSAGLAEGALSERDRQIELQNQLIEATNDFLASTKPLEGKMLEALNECSKENAKTEPTLPNRL